MLDKNNNISVIIFCFTLNMIDSQRVMDHIDEFTEWPDRAYFAVGISNTVIEHNHIYHQYSFQFHVHLYPFNSEFFPDNLHRLELRIMNSIETTDINLGGSFTLEFHMHWDYESNMAQFNHYTDDILSSDRYD